MNLNNQEGKYTIIKLQGIAASIYLIKIVINGKNSDEAVIKQYPQLSINYEFLSINFNLLLFSFAYASSETK